MILRSYLKNSSSFKALVGQSLLYSFCLIFLIIFQKLIIRQKHRNIFMEQELV